MEIEYSKGGKYHIVFSGPMPKETCAAVCGGREVGAEGFQRLNRHASIKHHTVLKKNASMERSVFKRIIQKNKPNLKENLSGILGNLTSPLSEQILFHVRNTPDK